MPAIAAESTAADVLDAAKTAETVKPVNGAVHELSKAELDERRRGKIRARYADGKPVSLADRKWAGIADEDDGFVRGYVGVIGHVFKVHGVTLSKVSIGAWRRGTSLPPGCNDPFPEPEPPDKFRISTFMPWILKHVPKPSENARNGRRNGKIVDWVGEKQRIIALREQRKLDKEKREDDGKHILRSDHEAASAMIVAKLRSIVLNAWKRQFATEMQPGFAKLVQSGLAGDALIAAGRDLFGEVGRKVIKNIEDQCEKL